MMEINTQSSQPTLISLSYASKLTGYHQDYLGQLCRAGKLPASKVGRNWFTSKEAVEKLTSPMSELQLIDELNEQSPQQEAEEFVDDTLYANSLEETKSTSQPVLVQSITISQVDGLPIAIRTVENPVRPSSNLQSIMTNMRVQSLQREVVELRRMLDILMTEVTNHAKILQARGMEQDSLKNSFVPTMDFGLSTPLNAFESSNRFSTREISPQIEQAPEWKITISQTEKFPYATWLAATAALVVLVYIAVGIFSGSFMGKANDEISSLYYHSPVITTSTVPTVAGDSISLPTGNSGENASNVIQ